MPMRKSAPPLIRRVECLAELSACIIEAETSTSAQAVTVGILAATGFDTSEVLRGLWSDMDALSTLRAVRRSLLA